MLEGAKSINAINDIVLSMGLKCQYAMLMY